MLSVLLPARPSSNLLSIPSFTWHALTSINKMPRRAYLLAFASIPQLSFSKIINGTVSDLLWPQMRSSIANYLIKNQISTGAAAYKKVFQKIPDSGNCWCFSDKSVTVRGEPQDSYSAFKNVGPASKFGNFWGFGVKLSAKKSIFQNCLAGSPFGLVLIHTKIFEHTVRRSL